MSGATQPRFHAEILLETDSARVRVMTLAAGEGTAWHRHSLVTDEMVGLEGELVVELAGPDRRVPLTAGERCTVLSGQRHRVINPGATPGAYLLVQGGGAYDFIVSAP